MATYGNNRSPTPPMVSRDRNTKNIINRQISRYAKYLPVAYIDRVVLDSPGSSPVRATIDFCIKEKLGEGTVNEWLSNPNLKKNLKIKLIQSTSKQSTEKLLFNIDITDVSDIEVISDITIDDVIGGADNYIENNSTVDSKGNTIVSLYFKRSFNINNVNPDYLCYFILTYLETSNNKTQNGSISKETIIDGSVKSKLTQDFRIFDKIKSLPMDLSYVDKEERALYQKIQPLSMDNMTPTRKESYFSEIFLSRDRLNRANFVFAVDYYKIARDSSVFGKLHENINNMSGESLFALSSITSIAIKRRRIKNSVSNNKLGNLIHGDHPFDKETIPIETLLTTHGEFGVLKPSSDDNFGLKEFHISTNNQNNIRFFTGYDNLIADMNGGKYQYGVEIIIEDTSKDYLRRVQSRMLSARNSLYSYYIEATKPGSTNYDIYTNTSEQESAETSESSGNYNFNSNKFTQNFIESQKEKSLGWNSLIIYYVKTLSMITGMDYNSTLNTFLGMIDPYKASPQSIMAVIKSMDDLITKIYFITDADTIEKGRNDLNGEAKSYTHSTRTNRITNIEHWFVNGEFDAGLEDNFGYDYLSNITSSLTNGVKLLSIKEYSQRINKEVAKYFSSGNSGGSLTTWSYLTPAYCYFGSPESSKVFDFYISREYDDYSTLSANILAHNSNSVSKEISLNNDKVKNTMTNLYSNLSLTIKSDDGHDLVKPLEPTDVVYQEPDVNPNEFFFSLMNSFSKNGATDELSTDNPFTDKTDSFNVGDQKIKPDELGIEIWNLQNTNLIKSKVPAASDILNSPPIQIKALITDQESWEKDPIKNLNMSSYFHFRYSMIGRVEVLSNFSNISIKGLTWEPLTAALLSIRKNTTGDSFLLCRIQPFEFPIMGIKQPKGLKLPIYDNYFILEVKK